MVRIHLKVQELIDARGITQKQLANETSIRPAAISEICNNLRTTINKGHLEIIADYLGVTDINDLIELRSSEHKG